MYICTDCGAIYEAENRPYYIDHLPYGEGFVDYKYYGCVCGGDLVQAAVCSICGEWKDADELSEGGICDACGCSIAKEARMLLREHFSVDELEYLREHLEEVL